MKPNKLCIALYFICSAMCGYAQQKPEISGYVSDMPSVIYGSNQYQSDTWWQNSLHNRLNLAWQLTKNLSFETSVRNRFITGSSAMINPSGITADAGWMDLSWNVFSANRNNNSSLLNIALDRLNFTFEKDKWQIRLGRQRINWGQTFVWNPNDIFNTYSFFDFDYPERPGCDALRATYYHSETASSELALSVNHEGKTTVALLHRWTLNNFDYQLIAGKQAESDIVVGGAWTGDFNGLNFRGEFSYFHPSAKMTDTTGIIAVSVGADRIFSNSLMLQAEVLYNNTNTQTYGLMSLYSAPLSAKQLSISDWNVFMQASYPVVPRLNAALSGMYFIDIRSYYTGLSLDYSIAENLDLSLIAQYFSTAGNSTLDKVKFLQGFARLKYSF